MLGAVIIIAVSGLPGAAQDIELEVTEDGLNRLIAQLGDPSGAGIHQPSPLASLGYHGCISLGSLDCSREATAAPEATAKKLGRVLLSRCEGPDGQSAVLPAAESISWQWWITGARFTVASQQLSFSATMRYRVDSDWFSEERTVPATLSLDVASQRLRLDISSFKLPIRYTANGANEAITEVDVGRHLSFAIPIAAQSIQVPRLDGSLKTLNARAQSANVEYLAGRIRVKVDAGIN